MEDLTQAIELLASIARLVRAGISLIQTIKLLLDSLANPTDDKHRLAVADRLIARAIGAFGCWLTAIWDAGVVAGKALKVFTLLRCEASNSSSGGYHWLAPAGSVFTSIEAFSLQGVSDVPSDANRVLLTVVPAKRVHQVMQHVRVLRAMHHQHAVLGILLGGTAGRLAISQQRSGDKVPGHAVIYVAPTISAPQRACHTILDAEGLAFHVQACVLGGQRGSLADISLEAVAAVRWNPGQHLNRRPFIPFAVRATVVAQV